MPRLLAAARAIARYSAWVTRIVAASARGAHGRRKEIKGPGATEGRRKRGWTLRKYFQKRACAQFLMVSSGAYRLCLFSITCDVFRSSCSVEWGVRVFERFCEEKAKRIEGAAGPTRCLCRTFRRAFCARLSFGPVTLPPSRRPRRIVPFLLPRSGVAQECSGRQNANVVVFI